MIYDQFIALMEANASAKRYSGKGKTDYEGMRKGAEDIEKIKQQNPELAEYLRHKRQSHLAGKMSADARARVKNMEAGKIRASHNDIEKEKESAKNLTTQGAASSIFAKTANSDMNKRQEKTAKYNRKKLMSNGKLSAKDKKKLAVAAAVAAGLGVAGYGAYKHYKKKKKQKKEKEGND